MATEYMTASEALQARGGDADERSLHRKVQRFIEKWTVAMDLDKRDAAKFVADFVTVVQAVHLDAGRETHELLKRAMAVMPPPVFVTKRDDGNMG